MAIQSCFSLLLLAIIIIIFIIIIIILQYMERICDFLICWHLKALLIAKDYLCKKLKTPTTLLLTECMNTVHDLDLLKDSIL